MASKLQHEAFNNKVIRALKELGAEPSDSPMYKWGLDTQYGKLGVSITEPYASSIFGIHTRFQDTKRASIFGYTGKWNFYDKEAGACLDKFLTELKEIL